MSSDVENGDMARSVGIPQSPDRDGVSPMNRAEEFIQLFNRVEKFLSRLVNPEQPLRFGRLVDQASKLGAAVLANAATLKQFAMLRNAIVHDVDYPPNVVAVPSPEALARFKRIAREVLPVPLMPTFARKVRCFSPHDSLPAVLGFMREYDFSQVLVRGPNGQLSMLTVEGISWWLADNFAENRAAILDEILALEPPGAFLTMGPDETVFDATNAFRDSIHSGSTRLYAIVVTEDGSAKGDAIGFVTPWDLVHSPHLPQ